MLLLETFFVVAASVVLIRFELESIGRRFLCSSIRAFVFAYLLDERLFFFERRFVDDQLLPELFAARFLHFLPRSRPFATIVGQTCIERVAFEPDLIVQLLQFFLGLLR